jgi:hypothetical protein
MPSELSVLYTLTNENKQRIASKEFDLIDNLKNNYNSLNEVFSFRKTNFRLYRSLSKEYRNKLDQRIEKKLNKILDNSILIELKGASLKTMDIRALNTFYKKNNSKYKKVSRYSQVRKVNKEISDTKIILLVNELRIIEMKIESSKSIDELTKIEDFYLSHIDLSSSPVADSLLKKASIQKGVIIEEIRLKEITKIEKQEIERQLKEAKALKRYGFSFNTKSLKNEELLKNFFKGNFIEIPFNKEDILFRVFINHFMYASARHCNSKRKKNSVQIYKDVCKKERVTTNGWGVEISRYCVEWTQQGTGLYTTSRLYDAYSHIKRIMNNDSFKNAWKLLAQIHKDKGFRNLNNMALDVKLLESDITEFIRLNGCNNKAIKRLEDNIIRFAHNKLPLKLDGAVLKINIDYSIEKNFKKLIDDLVYENSKKWSVNKFITHSVKDVKIVYKDNENRPIKISANYNYEGLFGYQKSNVKITFIDGVPDCLFFRDKPKICRTADRKIVSNFIGGKYNIK